jgi:AcrR family transcriptional regulator
MTDRRSTRSADRTDAIMRATLEVAQEIGYAKLSIEAVAARAGVGKHTVYRRWPSKGMLFHDSVLSLLQPTADLPETDDVKADFRRRLHATVDMMASEPWGPLFQALAGEIQHDPVVAASLNERFFGPLEVHSAARIERAKAAGQIAPDFDPSLAQAMLAGPVYYRFLITQEPVTYAFVDGLIEALFAGMEPRA